MSNFRKIKSLSKGCITVKCYYDRDWQEYQTRTYIDGKFQGEGCVYYTDDKQDAITSTEAIFNRLCEELNWEIA